MITRRKPLIALGAGAFAAPLAPFAQQQGKIWRVGFLGARRPVSLDTDAYGAFPRGMRELGYVEGKNLVIEWRFADGKFERLPGLAAKQQLPTIAAVREYVEAGGLMSYGPNFADLFRRAATYVDKILKSAKPGDLPVEQAMKFELIINAKTRHWGSRFRNRS